MDDAYCLLHGDCRERLRSLHDNSIDAIVTDPPYGLAFMGKKWDYDVPSADIWRECLRVLKPGGHLLAFAGTRTQHRMACNIEDAGFDIRDMIAWITNKTFPKSLNVSKAIDKAEVIAHLGDAARQWDGWGTALKPAMEPITVARKPLCGTVAENVLRHGTGGINVDGCRVGERWPANLIHDGSDEVVGLLGSAARFFYCAKASKRDRGEGNRHPTVKPTDLMRYLCRLVTPPGGTVLDPFMGSGSTGKAAMLEGFRFIGIEREAEYVEIAKARIQAAIQFPHE